MGTSKESARVLKGFRDYMPDVMVSRERMLAAVRSVFERFGFAPMSTPALEYCHVLLGKYGDEGDKLLYRFKDQGGRDVGLRYDLTVPLARVLGQHTDLTHPFKRYQIGPVWRAEKPAKGRFREFVQCDVDIVGEASMLADAECVMIAIAVLRELGIEQFTVHVNNRRILNGLLELLSVDSAQQAFVLRTVDKLPKIGAEGVKALLRDGGIPQQATDRLFDFLGLEFSDIEEYLKDSSEGSRGVQELGQLLDHIEAASCSERVQVDTSIARGLDYYTGTVFETFVLDLPDIGSVMSGGRYDELLGTFVGQPVPAVGISLGVDRLIAGLAELGLLQFGQPVVLAYVTVFGPEWLPKTVKLAQELRQAGIACEMAYSGKLKKQFRYAHRQSIPYVIVLGPDEDASHTVKIKQMETGAQHIVQRAEVVAWLKAHATGI